MTACISFSLSVSLSIGKKVLIRQSDLVISHGHRYGLIGHNGCGKSTLLGELANRKLKVPDAIDMFLVSQETLVNDQSVFETVLESNEKRAKIKEEIEHVENLLEEDASFDLIERYETLENELSFYRGDEALVHRILFGLGFENYQHEWSTNRFSGGWRMRISLAKALYNKPLLLLLDEPTNHLDLNAVIWLTEYLATEWKNTLIIVSHNQDFLNEVCTDIIHLHQQKLETYSGNYDQFQRMAIKQAEKQVKEWEKVQKKIKALQRKGTPKPEIQKILDEYVSIKPEKEYHVNFEIGNPPKIKGSLITLEDFSFGYNSTLLYEHVSLEIKPTTRITLVGKNGAGKSTLLGILSGDIHVDKRDSKQQLRIGHFHQHSMDVLPAELTPVEYLKTLKSDLFDQDARKLLGMTGLEGIAHTRPISTCSGGQKTRIVLASFKLIRPHLLLLDEPTNHLDIESIDALIEMINQFIGAVVTITHDSTLIQRTDSDVYEVVNRDLEPTTFEKYKNKILAEINNHIYVHTNTHI